MNLILETGDVILDAAQTPERASVVKRPSAFQCNCVEVNHETGEHCLRDLTEEEAEELLNWLGYKRCWNTEIDYQPKMGFIVRWQPPRSRFV